MLRDRVTVLSAWRKWTDNVAVFPLNRQTMPELIQWNNFYVIVGSSAGALIGLQFVVVALIADASRRVDAQASAAFSTPSVVHFAVVLLLSATTVAPWQGVTGIRGVWGAVGIGGVFYSFLVFMRLRKQTAYKPVFEDWLFHFILPYLAYAFLFAAALVISSSVLIALFMAGAVALLLLFVGIHNAWDTATYHVLVRRPSDRKEKKK